MRLRHQDVDKIAHSSVLARALANCVAYDSKRTFALVLLDLTNPVIFLGDRIRSPKELTGFVKSQTRCP